MCEVQIQVHNTKRKGLQTDKMKTNLMSKVRFEPA